MDPVLPGALSVGVGLTDDPVQDVSPAWALSVTQTMPKEAEALQTCPRFVQLKIIFQSP